MYTDDNGKPICACGKPCFKTKAEIKSYISYRNHRKGGDGFKYYKCDMCGCWHLTTNTPTGDNMLKKRASKYNRLEKKSEDMKIYRAYRLAV